MSNLQTENFSIIYVVDGSCFQRHYVNQDFENRFVSVLFKLKISVELSFYTLLFCLCVQFYLIKSAQI